jgi:hypothetical protein
MTLSGLESVVAAEAFEKIVAAVAIDSLSKVVAA